MSVIKERPILFSGPMVRAILDGRKTQTRRIVKLDGQSWDCCQPAGTENPPLWWDFYSPGSVSERIKCPYGKRGNFLWVKETFFNSRMDDSMPTHYWASRITLELTAVRVERLQSITEDDAIAEGISWIDGFEDLPIPTYKNLWKSINGPDSWDANPWVWVLSFRRVK